MEDSEKDMAVDDVAAQKFKAPIEMRAAAGLPSQEVHLLPCQIMLSGAAPVSTFFKVHEEPLSAEARGGEAVQKAQFRGRELTGGTVACPAGTTGYIFKEEDNGTTRVFNATHKFDQMTLWNRDKNKEERSFLKRAVQDWPRIAHAIHDPIEAVR